jgi:hypothetical protein
LPSKCKMASVEMCEDAYSHEARGGVKSVGK